MKIKRVNTAQNAHTISSCSFSLSLMTFHGRVSLKSYSKREQALTIAAGMGFVSSYLRWGGCYFLLSKKGDEFNWGNWIISSAVLYSHWSLFYFHYQIKSNSRCTHFCKYSSSQQKAFEILTWTMLQYIEQLYRALLWPFSSSENI